MQITIDLNRQITELDETPLEGEKNHLGKSVASRIGFLAPEQAKQVNAPLMKVYEWAKTLNVKKPLTLDESDANLFEELLPHLGLVLLVVGQVKEIVAEARDAAKKSKASKSQKTEEAAETAA